MPSDPPAANGDPPPESLRERKKARTRRELVRVSQRLFAAKGYANTTLDEISAEVEIRTQTLLRYFDSKAALAVAPMAAVVEDLRAKVTDPERTVDTISLWREHVGVRTMYHQMSSAAGVRRYYRWTKQDAALVAMTAQLNQQTQTILAEGIATDQGADPDDLHSTMLAALLVSGWNAVFIRWLGSTEDVDVLGRRQDAVIDFAVANLPSASAATLRQAISSV